MLALGGDASGLVGKGEGYGRPVVWVDLGGEVVEGCHFGTGGCWTIIAGGKERDAEGKGKEEGKEGDEEMHCSIMAFFYFCGGWGRILGLRS